MIEQLHGLSELTAVLLLLWCGQVYLVLHHMFSLYWRHSHSTGESLSSVSPKPRNHVYPGSTTLPRLSESRCARQLPDEDSEGSLAHSDPSIPGAQRHTSHGEKNKKAHCKKNWLARQIQYPVTDNGA